MRNFVLLVLCLSFHDLNCQSAIGFSLGVNYPQYFGHLDKYYYNSKFDPNLSYMFSAFIKQRHKRILNTVAEISFIHRTTSSNINYFSRGYSDSDEGYYKLNYLYFSIFPEFSIGSKHRLMLSIGPSFGLLLPSSANGIRKSFSVFGMDTTIYYTQAKKLFRIFDLRIFTSAAYEFPINSRYKLLFNSSISRGIINATKYGSTDFKKIINSFDYSFTFGIIYNITKFKFLPPNKNLYPNLK